MFDILSKIRASDLITNIKEWQLNSKEELKLEKRELDERPIDKPQNQIAFLNVESIETLQRQLLDNNKAFNRAISKLVVPIRFSIMALISARKSTVFSEDLFRLMAYIEEY